jgi:hypothetical protein
MGLTALVARLESVKAAWREACQRRDALLAEYEATLPAIPEVLFYTKRDSLLFGVSWWRIGEPLPKHVNYFKAFLKSKAGGYSVVGGKLTFAENREAKARAKEIIRACKDWIRTQNDHSRAIGLREICDACAEIKIDQADLCQRIMRIRAQSLDGLKVKAIAVRDLDFDPWYAALIRESIVRDLNTMTKTTVASAVSGVPESLVA